MDLPYSRTDSSTIRKKEVLTAMLFRSFCLLSHDSLFCLIFLFYNPLQPFLDFWLLWVPKLLRTDFFVFSNSQTLTFVLSFCSYGSNPIITVSLVHNFPMTHSFIQSLSQLSQYIWLKNLCSRSASAFWALHLCIQCPLDNLLGFLIGIIHLTLAK